MNSISTPTIQGRRLAIRGFTLIELMIVLAIVGILAAVAYPSFQKSIRKSRRADAVATLTKVQQAQERWRSNNSSYAANAALATAHPAGLGLASNGVLPLPTEKGYYTVAISGESATGYTVTATAVTGTSQVKDTGCTALSMVVVNGNVDGSTGYTPPGCWSK